MVRVPRALVVSDPTILAPLAGLEVSDDALPGVERRRCGRGFRYLDLDGSTLRSPRRDHYEALAVPPAWTGVWLSPEPIGHLQATGRDDAGRKQYRYHDAYRDLRDRQKFDRLGHFLRGLRQVRAATEEALGEPVGSRRHAVGAALALIDHGLLRVGNARSAAEGRYGTTTLTVDHLESDEDRAVVRFVGKGGVAREIEVDDDGLVEALVALRSARTGDDDSSLFWYEDDDGHRTPIRSADLNAAMADEIGPCFTVKDFRTWGGSATALEARASGASVLEAVDEAAEALGNTRAVARASYVHPAVLEADDDTIGAVWRGCRSSEHVGRADRALDRLLSVTPSLFC